MAARTTDRNRTKFLLDEKDIPSKWYNIQADLKTPAPPVLAPGHRRSPSDRKTCAPLFPMELIKQEVSRERLDSRSPTPCVTSIACGGRRRSTARGVWKDCSARRRASTTSTRA